MLELWSIPFMRQAMIASFLMVVMLAYLGIHVVKRRIVFVDLALAQLSAVGVTLGMLIDYDPVVVSLVVTLVGSALLSLPVYESRIPQEAIMGIVYAVASAATLLILSKMPHGEADLIGLFFGNILAVTPGQIDTLALIFGAVGCVHLIFFKKLMAISTADPSPARSAFWNLLFYLTLALVIAMAIRTAGVLLVFSDLIIPAVLALLFTEEIGIAIPVAIGIGLMANAIGLYGAFLFDLPAGPSIVGSLGGGLVLAFFAKGFLCLWKRKKR